MPGASDAWPDLSTCPLWASSPANSPAAQQAVARLTDREREVMVLVAQGLTNAQIASRLHLSLASVKAHLTGAFTKLGVNNRVSAAMAIRDARP
ncbi:MULTISPECIES: response regulator transcription factor [unclassified Luteococcus]|uniref:response regulator transcription factor n=1 Tax=unclassified Luteococcus TaxID=2639923 RepID=UPI00313D8F87